MSCSCFLQKEAKNALKFRPRQNNTFQQSSNRAQNSILCLVLSLVSSFIEELIQNNRQKINFTIFLSQAGVSQCQMILVH